MELFESKFHDSMTSKVALLNRITYYIVNRKGKQMRPIFVFLTAKMISGGTVNVRTYSWCFCNRIDSHRHFGARQRIGRQQPTAYFFLYQRTLEK
jgi:geranylgeranyl pyrophosphate synthase